MLVATLLECCTVMQGQQAGAIAQPSSAGKAEGSQKRGSRFTKFFKSEAEAGAVGTNVMPMHLSHQY